MVLKEMLFVVRLLVDVFLQRGPFSSIHLVANRISVILEINNEPVKHVLTLFILEFCIYFLT